MNNCRTTFRMKWDHLHPKTFDNFTVGCATMISLGWKKTLCCSTFPKLMWTFRLVRSFWRTRNRYESTESGSSNKQVSVQNRKTRGRQKKIPGGSVIWKVGADFWETNLQQIARKRRTFCGSNFEISALVWFVWWLVPDQEKNVENTISAFRSYKSNNELQSFGQLWGLLGFEQKGALFRQWPDSLQNSQICPCCHVVWDGYWWTWWAKIVLQVFICVHSYGDSFTFCAKATRMNSPNGEPEQITARPVDLKRQFNGWMG